MFSGSSYAINKATGMGYRALDLAKQKGWMDVVQSIKEKDCPPKDSCINGWGLSGVKSALLTYPCDTPKPPIYNSPRLPNGTKFISSSNIYTTVFPIALPMIV